MFTHYLLRLGLSDRADIAIDDLRVFENPCIITPADADPSLVPMTTPSTTRQTTLPPGPNDCTFEQGICNGWENMEGNRFNWTHIQGAVSAIPRKLPLSYVLMCSLTSAFDHLETDHTTGTSAGYFMFADLTNRQANDYARLKSGLLSDVQCMTFYYHLYGHGATLNLYMAIGTSLGIPLWTRTGTQGDVWRFARMTTTKNNANIVFEGNFQIEF